MNRNFSSIDEVIDYLQEIPEDKWTKWTIEDRDGKRCAMGHINYALHGHSDYVKENGDLASLRMLGLLGVDAWQLAEENNKAGDSKQNSIHYLLIIKNKNR